MSVATEDKMDPNNSYLGRTLLQEITPVVMVLSTPLVEQACSNNSLNFVQMLLPFSVFNNIDVPVRTAGDQPYRLQTFKLRLVYASDIRQQNVEAAEEHLKQVFSHAGEEVLCDLQQDPPELETVLTMAESNSLSSLFQIFNKEFIRTLSFSDHETFDHPVACLLVVSSKDDQPVNKFVDLFNTGQFPSLLNEGAMDPKILKYFLLVHDNLDGPSEKALDVLTEMRSTFGPNYCRLLCINSAQDGDEEHTDNPWASYKINDSPSSDVGRFLNINDLYEIKDLMQALSSKHTIPHMEQKIRALNQLVSATRKGFRNQIKNLWWRKGREDTFDMPNGPMYTFSSIESQIRVLGDYAFMLRDYELALSNYRLLSTDYKLDKAWKHYAGVQEMMGLSLFMLDQSRKDAEYCMETAFSTYLKIGSSGQRNATRCGLWWAEMLKARGQYKEAAVVYFRISNEEPSLHAAAMLEQASYCYLYSNPPMLRKYGFHLVLAGNRYSICDQRKHAIRSYRSALPVYKGYEWNYISDHVHFNIGRWFAFFGVFDVAIRHMLEVLACSHQSLATQQLFFGDFLHIVQNTGKKFYVFRLQLPIINMASLKVLYEDHRTYASPDAARVKETSWQSLEEEMVPSIPSVRANWLDSLPKSLFVKKNEESNVCVAGEAIKVDLEFKNPLQMSLSVHGASLVCKLFASSAVMGSDNPSVSDDDKMRVATGLYDDAEVNKFIREPDGDGATSFMSSKVDFTLEGGETKMVQLNVIPKMEGVLQIIGVRWTLSGFVVGYHDFDSNLSKKKHIRGRRNIASKNASICTLKFVVIKSLPRLEGFIHHLPQKTYAGDLRRLVLELRNHSESSVKNLKLRINHPRFLIPGKLKDLDLDFPICLEEQTSCQSSSIQDNAVEKSIGFVFSFPKESTVQDGMTFLWPLWLHTGVYGSISLNMSIYYEMENVSGDMSYRTLRMHYDLEVLPSLDISVHITPSPSRLEEYLVRMDVTNKSHSESFLLRQVSSIGNEWKISSLLPYILAEAQDGFSPQSDDATPRASCPSTAICPCQVLPAGQALSCFFKIMGSRKSSAMNGTTPSDRSVQKSDARLAPRSHDEALVDVSCSPLSEFHLHERTHQDKSIEEFRSAVDFILISQPQEDIASITPRGLSESPLLCSHYVCYCSISSISPIQWLMEGPHTVNHDFSISFCKIGFQMTIHNCSNAAAFIRISTFDVMTNTGWQSSDTARPSLSSSGGQVVGWHDLPFANSGSPSSVDGIISPFVWCASSSTQVRLESMSLAEVPLEICVFSPGTYDLSNYVLHWNLELSDDGEGKSSGMSPGHPFYLTILQSP